MMKEWIIAKLMLFIVTNDDETQRFSSIELVLSHYFYCPGILWLPNRICMKHVNLQWSWGPIVTWESEVIGDVLTHCTSMIYN